MANITVRVPDEIYRRARVRAAEQGTSVSALVADFLHGLDHDDIEFRRLASLQEELIEDIRARGGISTSDLPTREQLHDQAIEERGSRALR